MNKVLIASEDESCKTRFQETLSRGGFYTAVVHGVDEMLAFCRQHTPDVVVVDVDMESDRFWPTIQAVRSLRDLANLPLVGVSNVGRRETLQRAQDHGFEFVLPKKIDSKVLISSMQNLMADSPFAKPAAPSTFFKRLMELSEEVLALADGLSSRVDEFGTDGGELFGYIQSSGSEIADRLGTVSEGDLADKDLRHDFRNMIGSVTGFSELILMESGLSEETQDGFNRLRECSKEFVEILDQQKAANAV